MATPTGREREIVLVDVRSANPSPLADHLRQEMRRARLLFSCAAVGYGITALLVVLPVAILLASSARTMRGPRDWSPLALDAAPALRIASSPDTRNGSRELLNALSPAASFR